MQILLCVVTSPHNLVVNILLWIVPKDMSQVVCHMVYQLIDLCQSGVVLSMVVVMVLILSVVDLVAVVVVGTRCKSVKKVAHVSLGEFMVFMVLLGKSLSFLLHVVFHLGVLGFVLAWAHTVLVLV